MSSINETNRIEPRKKDPEFRETDLEIGHGRPVHWGESRELNNPEMKCRYMDNGQRRGRSGAVMEERGYKGLLLIQLVSFERAALIGGEEAGKESGNRDQESKTKEPGGGGL